MPILFQRTKSLGFSYSGLFHFGIDEIQCSQLHSVALKRPGRAPVKAEATAETVRQVRIFLFVQKNK